MLRESLDPLIRGEDVISHLFTSLFLKSQIGLRFNDLLKEARIYCSNHINEKLTGWPFCGGELIIHVFLDLFIIFHQLD